MREFFIRLRLMPLLTTQLGILTLFINILGFASPFFVMLILGSYVTAGFDQTLYTLSSGMLLALFMQLSLKQVRAGKATYISKDRDKKIDDMLFNVLTRGKAMALAYLPSGKQQEMVEHIQTVHQAYTPHYICAMLDAPFALAFVLATFWISPALAFTGIAGVLAIMIYAVITSAAQRYSFLQLQQTMAKLQAFITGAATSAETIRAFEADKLLHKKWKTSLSDFFQASTLATKAKNQPGQTFQIFTVLVRILVYAFGAKECVLGRIHIVDLIVANILISKGMQQAILVVEAGLQMSRARQSLDELKEFSKLPLQSGSGTALHSYQGRLSLQDVSFAFPGGTGPLFESFFITFHPGTLTLFHGANGVGKTTLARILTGLFEPMRGEILADGITLRQLASSWWHTQLVYLPQEPTLLSGTLKENLLVLNPAANDQELLLACNQANLSPFLESTKGLHTEIPHGGIHLPLGIRRRIALARALVSKGPLVIIDEPYEGLDSEGCKTIQSLIQNFIRETRTVIVFSHDENIIKSPHVTVDMNKRPTPSVRVNNAPQNANQREQQA